MNKDERKAVEHEEIDDKVLHKKRQKGIIKMKIEIVSTEYENLRVKKNK